MSISFPAAARGIRNRAPGCRSNRMPNPATTETAIPAIAVFTICQIS